MDEDEDEGRMEGQNRDSYTATWVSRALIEEFVQWLSNNPTMAEDLMETVLDEDDPLTVEVIIGEFLQEIGEE